MSPSFDDEDVPAGAIRAMMRDPASSAIPRSLPISRAQPFAPATARYAEPSARFEMPEPKFQSVPGLGDEISRGASTLSGLWDKYNKGVEIKDFDTQMKALKEQRKEYGDALAKLGSARTAPYLPDSVARDMAPADYNEYRSGIRTSESSGDDSAVNTTTNATGRYQFLPTTAQALMPGLNPADLKKPEIQEQLMKLYTDISTKTLEPLLGRKPTAGELYMLHFLGHAGGPHVLKNLDAPITETIGADARAANQKFLAPYKTGRELLAGLDARFRRQ